MEETNTHPGSSFGIWNLFECLGLLCLHLSAHDITGMGGWPEETTAGSHRFYSHCGFCVLTLRSCFGFTISCRIALVPIRRVIWNSGITFFTDFRWLSSR